MEVLIVGGLMLVSVLTVAISTTQYSEGSSSTHAGGLKHAIPARQRFCILHPAIPDVFPPIAPILDEDVVSHNPGSDSNVRERELLSKKVRPLDLVQKLLLRLV